MEQEVNLLVACVYLLPCVIWDIRTRLIPGWYLLSGLAAGIAGRIVLAVTGVLPVSDGFLSILPGLLLIFTAFLTGEKIGYGDGVCFVVMGLLEGWQSCLMILLFSFLFSSVLGGILFMSGRGKGSTTIPFLPFVMAGTAAAFLLLLGEKMS